MIENKNPSEFSSLRPSPTEWDPRARKFGRIFAFLAVIFFLGGGFFLVSHSKNLSPTPLLVKERGEGVRSEDIKYVELGGQKVKVDLALTPAEQTQGLSGKEGLGKDEGMLFVFEKPGYYLFWMPDMNFSIDIVWLTQDLKVDYIEKNATPESYPASFGPSAKDGEAKYVLEVPAGFSDKNNLKVGDSANFEY